MKNAGFLNVITELIGWPVVETETGATLGAVTDVAVLPTSGDLTGLLLLTNQGRQAALPTGWFQFNQPERKVCAGLDALLVGAEIERHFRGSIAACRDLLACEVVTREGRLLGQVSEAYVALVQPPHLIYRLTEPGLLRLLRRNYYLAGDTPYFYSRVDHRLIVPEIATAGRLCRSLAEAASKSANPAPPTLARTAAEGIKQASN